MLDLLHKLALEKSVGLEEEMFQLTSAFDIQAHFKPSVYDMPYSDRIRVVQTSAASGSCFCFGNSKDIPLSILGLDARKVVVSDKCLEIAVLDAVFGALPSNKPSAIFWLRGLPSEKSEARTTLIIGEINRLLSHFENLKRAPVITMVGAVGNVLRELRQIDKAQIYATDFDETLIGKRLGNVIVENGLKTKERLAESDIGLITAMTLASETLQDIIDVSRENKTKLVMFAETAAHIAPELINMGIDSIVAEEFPFYMFPGKTSVSIYRKGL